MAAKLYNLARMTTATTGTGTITLGSAVAGFLSFAGSGVADGTTVTYGIKDGSNSEIGRGVYTSSGTTLTRTVLKSTNSNNAISLSGSAVVFITAAAEDFHEGSLAGFRNRLINGCMRFNQRGSTSNTDDTYAFDRWNILTQTAAVGISAQTLIESGWTNAMRITQSQASAQRFGCNQIIESINCTDMRGSAVVASARVKCSASTNIRISILEWTGTADTVTSDSVLDWTSASYTAGGFFLSTTTTLVGTATTAVTGGTSATITASGTVSTSANNLIVLITTDSTQAQNVTLDIGNVQITTRSDATDEVFERRSFSAELTLCQRYFNKTFALATAPASSVSAEAILTTMTRGASTAQYLPCAWSYGVRMRVAPTVVIYNPGAAGSQFFCSSTGTSYTSCSGEGTEIACAFIGTSPAGSSVGDTVRIHAAASAEL